MPMDTVSILEGNEFVVSDARGDIDAMRRGVKTKPQPAQARRGSLL